MAIGSTALANFLIILVIGIFAGLTFNRYARSWLARLGTTTRSDVTAALVGVAGAFIGFHISVIQRSPSEGCRPWTLTSARCFHVCLQQPLRARLPRRRNSERRPHPAAGKWARTLTPPRGAGHQSSGVRSAPSASC